MKHVFQRKPLFIIVLFCAVAGILGILTAPASASVKCWEISPVCPSTGDVISISGKAAGNEIIEISILHEEMVPVSGNNYKYQINKLKVPKSISGGENLFTVNATGEDGAVVRDMNVRVKKFKWISRHVDARNGNATISQSNVPSWMSYFVKIDGEVASKKEGSEKNKEKNNSNKGQVKLTFETSYEAAQANPDGNFCFKYDTDSLPAGDYIINIGGIEKKLTLNPEKEKGSKHKNR
ncbi:hypothetical protein RSJ42_03720 [Methanosarcina hadiensis]|uniref:hypothetical protein n=1 Tax=Methanosarcina hadiensis TaxID=3078083 RepID=UPI003977B606